MAARTAAFLLLTVLAAGAAWAQTGGLPNVTVDVAYDRAAGSVLVNGVPVESFAPDPPGGMEAPMLSMGVGMWLVNGENRIAVEAKPTAEGGTTQVMISESYDAPPLLSETIAGEGRVEQTVTAEGLPRWVWQDAEPWQGDPAELLAAVAALHDAVARQDMVAYDRAHEAREVDFTVVFGPMPADMLAQTHGFLKDKPLQPLAQDLVATPYFEGRLWMVSEADGSPPVKVVDAENPDTRLMTGQYWSRLDGRWQVVR